MPLKANVKAFDAVTLRVKKMAASSRLSIDSSQEAIAGHSATFGSVGSLMVGCSSGVGPAPLGLGKRPLPSASVIYTGGQVGYSRSAQSVAERVDTTMSVLRALHNAKLAEAEARRRGSEPNVSMASVEAYDTSTKAVCISDQTNPILLD